MAKKRIRRGVDGWQRLLDEHRASGETVSAFCSVRGVPRSAFVKWRRRLEGTPARAPTKAPEFLPVPLRASLSRSEADVEVQLGSVRLSLSGAAASKVVEAIIARVSESR